VRMHPYLLDEALDWLMRAEDDSIAPWSVCSWGRGGVGVVHLPAVPLLVSGSSWKPSNVV